MKGASFQRGRAPGRWLALVAGGLAALGLCTLGGIVAWRAVARYLAEGPPPAPALLRGDPPHPPAPPAPPLPAKKAPEPPKEAEEEPPPCPIVPQPKFYRESGRTAELLGPGATAIVLGRAATEPERYAAERLAGLIERRFRMRIPVHVEGELLQDVRQAIVLGQRWTNAWLDRLCGENGLDLAADSPGHDGFIIEVVEDQGVQALLVGGSNPRGVIYGQDAFFDLLAAEAGRVVFPVASVRDWPSIAWRGRASDMLRVHVSMGTMDAYVRGRINFIDMRHVGEDVHSREKYIPPERRAGQGFKPGSVPDKPLVRQVIAEAHRRGMLVYGVVISGVRPDRFEEVLTTFRELIELGADGLWISFDDLGAGPNPEQLVPRVLDLARSHNIPEERVIVTPPYPVYMSLSDPWISRLAKVPGFDGARWIFTVVPSARTRQAAAEMGLKLPPAWWHNWPTHQHGILHALWPLRESKDVLNEGFEYKEVPHLALGWHSPTYERLRSAPEGTDCVLLFGGSFQEEYLESSFGRWAWEPERHDWQRMRTSIYSHVYGPGNAAAGHSFDDRFIELKGLFTLVRTPDPLLGVNWPPRLSNVFLRPKALDLIAQMAAAQEELQAKAPAATGIDRETLERRYLEPMRATVHYARAMATLDYPEYAYPELQARIGELVATRRVAEAEETFREAGRLLVERARRCEQALAGLKGMDDYRAHWERRIAAYPPPPEDDAARRERLDRAFKEHFARADYGKFLAPLGRPPEGALAAEVSPGKWIEGVRTAWGPWAMGGVAGPEGAVTCIGWPQQGPEDTLCHFETRVTLPVLESVENVVADVFVGGSAARGAPRTRFAQFWAGDRLLWERDVTEPPEGKEWLGFHLADVARGTSQLELLFRIVSRSGGGSFSSVILLGPVRLRAALAAHPREGAKEERKRPVTTTTSSERQ